MNTRVVEAIDALVSGEGDSRKRVAMACTILDGMHPKELPLDSQQSVDKIKNDAGKKGALRSATGEVIRDKYAHTLIKRKNKTYAKLARELYGVLIKNL